MTIALRVIIVTAFVAAILIAFLIALMQEWAATDD